MNAMVILTLFQSYDNKPKINNTNTYLRLTCSRWDPNSFSKGVFGIRDRWPHPSPRPEVIKYHTSVKIFKFKYLFNFSIFAYQYKYIIIYIYINFHIYKLYNCKRLVLVMLFFFDRYNAKGSTKIIYINVNFSKRTTCFLRNPCWIQFTQVTFIFLQKEYRQLMISKRRQTSLSLWVYSEAWKHCRRVTNELCSMQAIIWTFNDCSQYVVCQLEIPNEIKRAFLGHNNMLNTRMYHNETGTIEFIQKPLILLIVSLVIKRKFVFQACDCLSLERQLFWKTQENLSFGIFSCRCLSLM